MALWNATYETGHETVDNDHKEIFKLVEEVLSSSRVPRKDKVETAITFLAQYVIRHFANEEILMEECNYPETDTHKKEHADFLEAAVNLQEQFVNDTYTLGETNNDLHLSIEINKTVIAWLTKHVMGSDKKMARFYREWKENPS